MDRENEARKVLNERVLPRANSKLSTDSDVEYGVVEDKETLANKVTSGLVGGNVLYIAPVDKNTGEPVVDPSLLSQMGVRGGLDGFQDHILNAFHELREDDVADNYVSEDPEEKESSFVRETEVTDLFNVNAGHAYAKVRLDPFIANI